MANGPSNTEHTQPISGQRFESPVYVEGGVTGEPERYLAEKPYELSKYEFSILKKPKFRSDVWFYLILGATAGVVILILGKVLAALIQKQSPTLESWELWAVVAGIVMALSFKKFRKKSPEEKEFEEIMQYIDEHFRATPRRRVHITRTTGSDQ